MYGWTHDLMVSVGQPYQGSHTLSLFYCYKLTLVLVSPLFHRYLLFYLDAIVECRGWTHDHLASIGQPYQLSYIHLRNYTLSLSLSLSLSWMCGKLQISWHWSPFKSIKWTTCGSNRKPKVGKKTGSMESLDSTRKTHRERERVNT